MRTVYKNIKQLIGAYSSPTGLLEGQAMSAVPVVDNAFLIVTDGVVERLGEMNSLKDDDLQDCNVVDLSGQFVLPAFADSHTHIVYAGSREQEYEDKIRGLSYVEIAQRGGGILNSADLLRRTSESDLFAMSMERLQRCIESGTGAIEIKSGYGLSVESELKMLRVIKRMKEESPVAVKSNFLAAHAFPREYATDHDGYVSLIVDEMLPEVAKEGLADFVDVFCDEGFFTVGQTERILEAAAKYGILPKIHANELARSGGIQTGVKYHALSVDHLEHTGDEEIAALKGSGTIATVLPGAAFFLGMPYAPARRMIDSGLAVAVASDNNPGSSPSASMKFVLSLASIKMKLSPVEALNAATVNGAFAMGLGGSHGQIVPGWKANLIITKPMPSFTYFSYAYTENLIDNMIINK